MKKTIRLLLPVFVILTMLLAYMPVQLVQAAAPTELFISEYIEGSSNNKAIEIYNGTGSAINLATGGYNIQMYFNGNSSASLTINLTGVVAAGDVYVIAHSSAVAEILAQADQTNGASWFNGNDAVILRKGTSIIDSIGQIGFNPGTEWGTGLVSTADNTLRRMSSICAGDPNGSDTFDPSLEWEGFATNTFGGLGSHTVSCSPDDQAPEVASTYPIDGATNFPVAANLSVTFSEPVNTTGNWFTLVCTISGDVSAAVSGGPTSFTLDPGINLVSGESCTLTILSSQVTDQDLIDPPDNMVLDFTVGFSPYDVCAQSYTPIYDIQGSGATAAIIGTVTTMGIVVGDYEGGTSPQLRGFYIQDQTGDGDLLTSDGIFVYDGNNANKVNLGDLVRVTGAASEYQGQTQITSYNDITKCGTGSVTPTDVTLPFDTVDFPERYEGMLVRMPQTLYVTEHYQLGRFNEVLLSSGGRLQQPTNVVEPGDPAIALQLQNNLNQILVDDASQAQNVDPISFARNGLPLSASNTLRGGDTTTGIVGIMTYTWGGNSASPNSYRVRPINALNGYIYFEAVNERPSSAPDLSGSLRVVGMNGLNVFNTFDGYPDNVDNCTLGVGGAATDCRGADNQAEFDRQWPKTVAAILKMNADVIGFTELENDGYGPDSVLQFLVDKLNEATAPGTYTFIDADAGTGQVNSLGTDAIKVGLIYKPATVNPVGTTAALNSVEFVNGGDSAPRNRPALAQAFEEASTGGRFVVTVNHLKSKGSACEDPDLADGQGNCNTVRVNAANELTAWLASDPTGTGEPDALIIGDLNSYAMEDPVIAIQNAGYTNLVEAFLGPDAYSYVFDGQWGYLDHALGNGTLSPQVAGVFDYHINADEPSVLDYNTDYKTANLQIVLYAPDEFRISDHDPVLIDMNLLNTPVVNAGGPYTADEGQTITLTASAVDPDGETVTLEWDLNNDGIFETAGESVSYTAKDNPSESVPVRGTNPEGAYAIAYALITVNNVAPTLGELTAPLDPLPINTEAAVSADFTDPGILDTHTTMIDWGDGTVESGSVTETDGSGTASGTHAYTTPGLYTVKMTVTDKDGAVSNESVFEYIVVYDPDGGFVTGGGWIASPAGAYALEPTLEGKATFGFVAKYQKGAEIPIGNTEFQFHAGDLNFKSTSYDWLVLAGKKGQFKGMGTINGEGEYKFMLTAEDNNPDTFRIKIWTETDGVETIIYDNGSQQVINGGSISVKK